LTVVQGNSGTSTISETDLNGFNGSVTLSASGLPNGVTAVFNPDPTTGTSTLTLTASSTATTGTTTVKAATTVNVGGVSLTRATGDGKVGDSADANKTWSDDTVRTDVHNAAHGVITTAAVGDVVHDKVFVAKAAGTTTPTLYERFKDRDALLVGVLDRVADEMLVRLQPIPSVEGMAEEFLRFCPQFERSLKRDGIILVKYWLSVSDEEQERRFQARATDPMRRWKLSPMDLESRARWVAYSRAKDEMFRYTDIKHAPWWVVQADDKRRARLNCIAHLLSQVEYEDLTPPPLELPPRVELPYVRPPMEEQTFVPQVY
jgi:AcrR family transcriptional regulator